MIPFLDRIKQAFAPESDDDVTNKKYVDDADATKAPLDSPGLTGVPTAPTAEPGTDTEQIATTAFATGAVNASVDTLQTALNAKAPLDSPALTGSPTAPTPATSDNSTKVATTAYVTAKVGAASSSGAFPTPKTAAGVGQWVKPSKAAITNSSGVAIRHCQLPAGGTWAYSVDHAQVGYAGVAAGGTVIFTTSYQNSANDVTGFAWRIA